MVIKDTFSLLEKYDGLIEKIQIYVNELTGFKYDLVVKSSRFVFKYKSITYLDFDNKRLNNSCDNEVFILEINEDNLDIYYIEENEDYYGDSTKSYEFLVSVPLTVFDNNINAFYSSLFEKNYLVKNMEETTEDINKQIEEEKRIYGQKLLNYRLSFLTKENFNNINENYKKYHKFYTGSRYSNNEHFIYDEEDKKIKLVSDIETNCIFFLNENGRFEYRGNPKYDKFNNVFYRICSILSISIISANSSHEIPKKAKEHLDDKVENLKNILEKKYSVFLSKIKELENIKNIPIGQMLIIKDSYKKELEKETEINNSKIKELYINIHNKLMDLDVLKYMLSNLLYVNECAIKKDKLTVVDMGEGCELKETYELKEANLILTFYQGFNDIKNIITLPLSILENDEKIKEIFIIENIKHTQNN